MARQTDLSRWCEKTKTILVCLLFGNAGLVCLLASRVEKWLSFAGVMGIYVCRGIEGRSGF